MTDEQKSALIKLAAEMALGQDMPPFYDSDWHLPKTTPVKARREINTRSQIAHAQCNQWARRIFAIVDSMK